MSDIENATPFGVRVMPSCDREGRDVLLDRGRGPLSIARPWLRRSTSSPFPHAGAASAWRRVSRRTRDQQHPPRRPIAVYEAGDRHLCLGRRMRAERHAGHRDEGERQGRSVRRQSARLGDRVWQRALTLGVRPSCSARLSGCRSSGSAPMAVWRRAPRRSARCSSRETRSAAVLRPTPTRQSESRAQYRGSTSAADPGIRPATAGGVGPVARHWQPRASYAGTYDEAWRRQRAPIGRTDFDERFFCGAPSSTSGVAAPEGRRRSVLRGPTPGRVDPVRSSDASDGIPRAAS